MTLGELIKAYCDEHGLSMQRFAENAHVSKGYISMLIKGRNPSTGKPPVPTVKTLNGIAEAMGVSPYDLLGQIAGDVETQYSPAPPQEPRSFEGLADAIVEKLRESDDFGVPVDDELWQMREDMRRNPELRVLYDLQRNATKSELKQMQAFIKAIRSSNDKENDDPA